MKHCLGDVNGAGGQIHLEGRCMLNVLLKYSDTLKAQEDAILILKSV